MHSGCLVCNGFKHLLSGVSACARVYAPNIAFHTNIVQSKALENHMKKCMGSPCHLLFIHTVIATNHMYNYQ